MSDGQRNEVRGAPGGRTRYPIMMRKVRLDAAIATSASIKSCGNIVEYYNAALGFQPVGDTRRMRSYLTDDPF